MTLENLASKTNVWMFVDWKEFVEIMPNVLPSITPLSALANQGILAIQPLDVPRSNNVLSEMIVQIICCVLSEFVHVS